MRHGVAGKKLNRPMGPRNALRRTLITQLLLNEQIETTRAKAEAIRGAAEHMITQVKRSMKHPEPARQLHIRRLLNGRLSSKSATERIFTEYAPRFENRPGGYTRMYKLSPRKGDMSEMVLLEFVDRPTDAALPTANTTGTQAQPRVGAGRARELLNRLRGRGANQGVNPNAPINPVTNPRVVPAVDDTAVASADNESNAVPNADQTINPTSVDNDVLNNADNGANPRPDQTPQS